MQRRQYIARAIAAVGIVLVVVSGALLALRPAAVDPAASAPADLQAPLGLSLDELHQWCVDRQKQGTVGLSATAKTWLKGCAEAAGTSPTDSSSPTGTTTTPPPATTPSPTRTLTRSGCPVTGGNTPGAADTSGGCWPGPGNTGVPAGTALTAYTGPCTITAANTVIDSKTVTCASLSIQAAGVIIRKSRLVGTDVTNANQAGASFTIVDSTVSNGARDQCMCVGSHDFTALRIEVVGGNRSMYCELRCTVQDSWLHGQQLQGAQHGSALRQEQYTTATHNSLSCDWAHPNDSTSLGCSADLGGYPDFAAITHNTYRSNLFVAASRDSNNVNPSGPGATTAFCAVGGRATGKDFSNDPANATYIVFTDNVWQRGITGRCGDAGAIDGFVVGGAGNQWLNNRWDNGGTVSPG